MSKTTTTMPYFKFDSGRFLGETRGLPLVAIGMYALLQSLYWEAGCRLPSEEG